VVHPQKGVCGLFSGVGYYAEAPETQNKEKNHRCETS